jgi:hypothetical protein
MADAISTTSVSKVPASENDVFALVDTLAVMVYLESHMGESTALWQLMFQKAEKAAMQAAPDGVSVGQLLQMAKDSSRLHLDMENVPENSYLQSLLSVDAMLDEDGELKLPDSKRVRVTEDPRDDEAEGTESHESGDAAPVESSI